MNATASTINIHLPDTLGLPMNASSATHQQSESREPAQQPKPTAWLDGSDELPEGDLRRIVGGQIKGVGDLQALTSFPSPYGLRY